MLAGEPGRTSRRTATLLLNSIGQVNGVVEI